MPVGSLRSRFRTRPQHRFALARCLARMHASAPPLLLACFAPFAWQERPIEVARETYPDGRPRLQRELARDESGELVAHGASSEWFSNGQLAAKGRFTHGLKHGVWETWYETGDPASKGRFERGARTGRWRFWQPDGSDDLERSGEYELERIEGDGGETRALGYRVDSRRHGPWRFIWPDGSLQFAGRYRNGLREGAWIFFHRDGSRASLLLTGEYEAGARARPLEAARLAGLQPENDEGLDLPAPSARNGKALPQSAVSTPSPRRSPWDGAEMLATIEGWDLADPEAANKGGSGPVPLALQALGCEKGFGWSSEPTEAGLEQRREVVRSVRSLCELKRSDAVFWCLDGASWTPRGDALIAAPPLLPEDRAGFSERAIASAHFAGRFQLDKPHRAAIAQGLAWLARHQGEDGGWSSRAFMHATGSEGGCGCDGPGETGWDVGVSALALLAFLGDGHTPFRGEHSAVVTRCLAYLLDKQAQEDGSFRTYWAGEGSSRLFHSLFVYEHALATNALAEAYSLTGHQVLRERLGPAVNYLQEFRNPYSAWRYAKPGNGESDTSVTAWAVQALRSAEEAGLPVDRVAFEGALAWIDEVTDPATGRCGYDSIGSPSARIARVNDHYPGTRAEAMTGAALLCRFLVGQQPEQVPIMQQHANLIRQQLPAWETDPRAGGSDMYYWYYGSHALFQLGGKAWEDWNKALKFAVVDSQRKDGDFLGSWDPAPCPWGFAGGRVYATAIQTLSLEAPTRIGRLARANAPPPRR